MQTMMEAIVEASATPAVLKDQLHCLAQKGKNFCMKSVASMKTLAANISTSGFDFSNVEASGVCGKGVQPV